jgi:hypothetical protein
MLSTKERSLKRHLPHSLHYTTEYLFCQGQFRPVTGPARIMLLGFLLMVLAAIAGYTAQLASFLTNKGLVSSVLVCAKGLLGKVNARPDHSPLRRCSGVPTVAGPCVARHHFGVF